MKHIKTAIKYFYLYLSLIGLLSFSLFIMEEACQSLQFANFSCSDTRRYDLMKLNIERIETINNHIKILNRYLMWLQPIQWWGYYDYSKNLDLYVKSLQAEILANDPGLYVDQQVSIWFYYKSISKYQDLIKLSAGKMFYLTDTQPDKNPIHITGIIKKINNGYLIE